MAIKTSGYSNKTRLAKKSKRQYEANFRNAAWRQLSTTEKLASLDNRGMRAAKQRKRLAGK